MSRAEIQFVRLTEISLTDVVQHMSDPRVAIHLPLLSEPWDTEAAERFVAAKEACWTRDGLGHWGILADGTYAGWGGFQKEETEWDFGLVLSPEFFGIGTRVAQQALAFAKADPRIPFVTFLLPPSRCHLGALGRLGATPLGEVSYDGERFLKFRLDTPG